MVTSLPSTNGKPLSNSSGARRQRDWRARKRVREEEERASTIASASSPPRNTNAPSSSSSSLSPPPPPPPTFPLHETQPVSATADVFTAPALVLLDGSGTTHEATSDAPAEPVVPPKPEPPPPPPPTTSPNEAAMIAKLLGGYLRLGLAQIATKRPELVAQLASFAPPGLPPQQAVAALVGIYEQAAMNLALKYNVRIPYQDELVVAVGLGVATWGFAMEPSKAARAATAKNANVAAATQAPTEPAAPSNAPAAEPETEFKLNV